jgi:endonuclease/exonuclease/phosphatase family metal-dependent hydrolase
MSAVMAQGERSPLTHVTSTMIWVYGLLCAVVWFGAHLVPGDLVLVRIATDILCDIVWLPMGVGCWWVLFGVIARFIGKSRRAGAFHTVAALVAAIMIVALSPQVAFRFLFIPMTLVTVRMIRRITSDGGRGLAAVMPILTIIVLMTLQYRTQLVPSSFRAPRDHSLSMMTYNIRRISDAESRRAVVATIREAATDIVCLSEFIPRNDMRTIVYPLLDQYPFHFANMDSTSRRNGEIILSRYPLTHLESGGAGKSTYLACRVEFNGASVTMAQVHLSRGVDHIARLEDLRWPEPNQLESLTISEQKSNSRTYGEARKVLSTLDMLQGPKIVFGDFNATPCSRIYRLFAENSRDVFGVAGWGTGCTFGEKWLREWLKDRWFTPLIARDMLRIDHCFVDPGVRVVSSSVIATAHGSDHKPLVTVIDVDLRE